jgi:preprotein translocase subunit YajC
MMAIIDTIMIILFVLFMAFLVIGFNRTQYEKHQKRIEENEQKNDTE